MEGACTARPDSAERAPPARQDFRDFVENLRHHAADGFSASAARRSVLRGSSDRGMRMIAEGGNIASGLGCRGQPALQDNREGRREDWVVLRFRRVLLLSAEPPAKSVDGGREIRRSFGPQRAEPASRPLSQPTEAKGDRYQPLDA